jgi:hypothetical protein
MSGFEVVEPANPDEAGFEEAWESAFEAAKGYWQPGAEVSAAEILVDGPIHLSRRLQLIPLLRELGLLT